MSQILYEYSGPMLDSTQSEKFMAAVGRDYYAADCKVRPQQEDLYLCNTRNWAGELPISEHRCIGARTVVKRSSQQVQNSAEDIFLLWIPVRGSVTITQSGRSAMVARGNLALSSSLEPLCIETMPDDGSEHLSYQISLPVHILADALSEPRRYCAIGYSSNAGAARIARELFLSLYEESGNTDRASSMILAQSALNALFCAVTEDKDAPVRLAGARELKLQRLLDYIALHHSDPELTTEKAAAACEISTRYLHYLLQGRGMKFHDHLWEARLDSAFRQLTDPALDRRTIAEIAYSAGFKSSAHFSRAFRRRFSQSPREVRERCALENESFINSGSGLRRH
ncbi:AraC family transcriptional regulator [Tardibacter chloracetimidivorans]|uniref:AraC family transcriptional regulator n=1 Tax=Tardibacter chloracetimidivorans TaxID=1921510 RepID=A0A1L3ZUS2_9SPHN|nr:helix-turn-helix domain-containing protein [Tardibacter chloracetimidivorans]API59383.1 AraC family transcriptional regulator [Tardibacter chloracetimidivorans]